MSCTRRTVLMMKNEHFCLQMRNETLGAVQNPKYLGVHIADSLDWKKHIQATSKKISRSFRMLKYAKDIFLSMHLKISTPVSLILASGTAVLCGVCVVQPKSTNRNFKIELPESSPVAITMPLVSGRFGLEND